MNKPANKRREAENEAKVVTRTIRVSPRKLDLVAASIRGKKASTAVNELTFSKKRIAQDVKLPSQFAALVPKVRAFLEQRAFGGPVDLSAPEMVKAIGSNVAHYVTVKHMDRLLDWLDKIGEPLIEGDKGGRFERATPEPTPAS